MRNIDDAFLRTILSIININQLCYVLLDNTSWLESMGLVRMSSKRSQLIKKWCNLFWLYSGLLYLFRDLKEIIALVRANEAANEYKLNSAVRKATSQQTLLFRNIFVKYFKKLLIIFLQRKNLPLVIDTLKNSFDLLLPLANLDYIKVSIGTQGLFGLLSSLFGLFTLIYPKLKLTPS
jgi:peroxin-11B